MVIESHSGEHSDSRINTRFWVRPDLIGTYQNDKDNPLLFYKQGSGLSFQTESLELLKSVRHKALFEPHPDLVVDKAKSKLRWAGN